jgi:hypothetical protein
MSASFYEAVQLSSRILAAQLELRRPLSGPLQFGRLRQQRQESRQRRAQLQS